MSELINKSGDCGTIRRYLLTTASAFTLIGCLYGAEAKAEGDDRPTVWVELGGQLERMPRAEEIFSPIFPLRTPRPEFETVSPLSLLHAPRYAVGGEGKLSFEPAGSNWVFSAAVRYGRSNGKKHFHNQTYTPIEVANTHDDHALATPGRFQDVTTDYDESHAVLDFTIGRDVGLGLFGNSMASLGMRYAQFSTTSMIGISSKPDFVKHRLPFLFGKYYSKLGFHNYVAEAQAEHNFHGIGPSLSFTGNTPIAGGEDGGVTFDWGLNGALLFGRQSTTTKHHTYGRYVQALKTPTNPTYLHSHNRTSSHRITVPNLGAFAGLSMRYTNAKVSFGYRADVFFGAMDGGLDTRKSYDRSFYGPFATISIGLGG